MSKKNMKRRVILLAYLHYYMLPVSMVFLVLFCDSKRAVLLFFGIGFLLDSAYTLIGYLRKWKHIYCYWQKVNRQKMNPYGINWDKLPKSEIYAIALIFAACGILFITTVLIWG